MHVSEGSRAVLAIVRRRTCHPVRSACCQTTRGFAGAAAPGVACLRPATSDPDLERRYPDRIRAGGPGYLAVPVRPALVGGDRRADVPGPLPDALPQSAAAVSQFGLAGRAHPASKTG